MSIEYRITQALAARPYLVRSDIEACARRMMAAERVGQTSILGQELNYDTIVPSDPHGAMSMQHVGYFGQALIEAASIGSRLYASAVVAALVTANVSETELLARKAHWSDGLWTDPLAVLSHIASLPVTHPKVKAFNVSVSTQAISLGADMNKPSRIKAMIELRITRTK